MEPGEQHEGGGDGGGERVSDEALLRWAGDTSKARGRVQAARDVGLNYRTLARAIDEQALSRVVREALLAAHRAESVQGTAAAGEAGAELGRRVEATETQLADALGALGHERERADKLERRLALLEEQKAGEPSAAQPAGKPGPEQHAGESGAEQEADAGDPMAPTTVPDVRSTHRPGVVTLEPLDGEEAALGEAAGLVAEWRSLRSGDNRWRSAVERARAEERRWELELALIEDHGLALPPETEPLHPSRRDDQLRWRRVTLRRVRGQRVRAERLRLLRRVLTLGLWWR